MIAAVITRPTSGSTTGRTGSEQSVRLPLRRSSGVRLAALWACLVGSGLAALGADMYVLREVRGASGWLRGHSGRHTSPRTIPRRSVTGCWAFTPDGRFHSRRARRPASCARGLSAREEAGPDPPKDAHWRETLVYTPGGCRGGRSDFKADSGRVYRAELGPPLAERRRAFRILFYPPGIPRGIRR